DVDDVGGFILSIVGRETGILFAGRVIFARRAASFFAPWRVTARQSFGTAVGSGLEFGFRSRLFLKQRLPVGDRNLIVVGMDFVERQKVVPVAAVIDEGSLQRRFNARDFGEIDVAAQKFASVTLEVDFLYPTVPLLHDPIFLGVRGIDEHFRVGH